MLYLKQKKRFATNYFAKRYEFIVIPLGRTQIKYCELKINYLGFPKYDARSNYALQISFNELLMIDE